MNKTLQSIQKVFTRALDQELNIDEYTTRGDLDEWDSLAHLNLIIELEEEFELEFTSDEIANLVSVRQIIEKIINKDVKL